MVWAWQLWLSPRPPHRSITATQSSFTATGNSARYDVLTVPDGLWGVRETHYIDNPRVKAGESGPPLHLHLLQDEYFQVEQGVLGVILDGKEHVITKDDGILCVGIGSRHRFWSHQSAKESLVFRAWADPCKDIDHILDVNFLRNIAGYLADCHAAGLAPSMFQLMLFYYDASSLLCPPFLDWMPLWLLTFVHYVLAVWIGAKFLGYKPAYPEYTAKPRTD
ncbi:uncharacterized protein BCR38DRAFT_415851 [Pseudomassariella vexata]|uniref:Cupin 2 conserved barrel domain-containing protein n=1 Tax=Pseudomassariella vexata TaxID=1141098 RepID=A0A1Y2EHM2_9PEZI|nr:uncharacterized protein BCR38DRAFT_415851 [Pseudomassariella vexata]ORY71070.1 hypothetical protein BCR38DRAFT_415851 [Pseudomassariella vexata]